MSDWGNDYKSAGVKRVGQPCPERDLSGACEHHHPTGDLLGTVEELRSFLDGMRKLLEVRREAAGVHAFAQRIAAIADLELEIAALKRAQAELRAKAARLASAVLCAPKDSRAAADDVYEYLVAHDRAHQRQEATDDE